MARCVGVFKSLNFLLSLVCVLLHCQKQIRVQAGTHKRGGMPQYTRSLRAGEYVLVATLGHWCSGPREWVSRGRRC